MKQEPDMELANPNKLKKLWDLWDIRVSVLLSLFLRTHAYLGDKDVFAFWASFLLLHLGGPDTITAFSLEDNDLWLRHLFGLLQQLLGAERTVALYLASLDRFGATALPKPYPGPDYEEAVAIYSTTRSIQVPEQTEITTGVLVPNLGNYKDHKFDLYLHPYSESDQMELLLIAHLYSRTSRDLLSASFSASNMENQAENSFSVEILRAGLIVRLITFFFMVGAFILFQFLVDKDDFNKLDLILTYGLLTGAMCLDVISGFRSFSLIGGILDKIKMMRISSSEYEIEDLKCLIFEELKKKSSKINNLSDAIENCSQRGDGALFGTSSYIKLKWSISEFHYAESLLLWHLATQLCYHEEKKEHPGPETDGIRSKSVLFDACILAQQLRHLEKDPWELVSKVWVELLAYGAINCRPNLHAQQPSRGGELLTFTWLLMNHLGLGSQFHEQERQAGTKVVAVK
ncbi:hypothetical protein FEM48_Zijuj04G0012200 [Ziziphus jujuba var. spinosa]|uniref:DUF4220 domain-containing protein n=1 Tax=Ziziphus jujuba var. spinosa TaxID=714518 RepID=A0A978VGZ7_ZIZJJ|nr:hypothetical protein FEM48_Zijuj04G0012200 [Ziziphus jujuba var. spinosa]